MFYGVDCRDKYLMFRLRGIKRDLVSRMPVFVLNYRSGDELLMLYGKKFVYNNVIFFVFLKYFILFNK